MKSFVNSFVHLALWATALATPLVPVSVSPHHHSKSLSSRDSQSLSSRDPNSLSPRADCENGPDSRNCWGQYSIDTDFYKVYPDTGVTREYWLTLEEKDDCNYDGYTRYCQTINGTSPGPLIWADWGDHVVIHVTNNMQTNGTAIHWHGIQQRNSVEYDGVPGVTQCPIAPGKTLTYKWHATQYGSSWYHSHFTLQSANGAIGPLLINGPATANYDIDMGVLILQDLLHESAFVGWANSASGGIPPGPANALINGTNTFDCTGSSDANCVGGGKKYEMVFTPGKKHLIRLVNTAADAHMEFSIDGHNLTVIAADFVPIVPYTTKSVKISIAQRYDIIVEANATPDNYWLRSGIDCSPASDGDSLRGNATAIVRYDANSTADPTSVIDVTHSGACDDEALSDLVPHLSLDVGSITGNSTQTLGFSPTGDSLGHNWFQWTLNSSSLVLNWSEPVLKKSLENTPIFPTPYNIVRADKSSSVGNITQWFGLIIDGSSLAIQLDHPIHVHGHDFWILSQDTTAFSNTTVLNHNNPIRRDTAILPAGGHLALAFELDNPGSWIVHCHIAWHASQGLSLNIVESEDSISVATADHTIFDQTCTDWDAFEASMPFAQEDSGI
ncbi:hypothetical protein MCOR25_001527 [Pyricularia grisea]|uniref:Laccase n=1 Tax=Pyricularia grisea TaxID=148305 RepID=A0A6P8ANP9_PYRGI|nr:uncharacterized protein PgNI_11872 [Pyricularia grisea]KAI6380858.1 hypothetical protein MCOR25_001527 [Pyricularia grisea]TLD03662.1 hypothetical protein PgNI_11872 [Pyricularia grisea]